MRTKKKIILLGANFETGNMGVNALTAGAVRCMLGAFQDAEFTLLDYARQSTTHLLRTNGQEIPVRLENMRFSKRVYLPHNIVMLLCIAIASRLIPFRSLRRRLLNRNRCLRTILEADITGSIAGGDSFSDIYGLRRLIYVALPQILVLLLDAPLILLPQTIGPFKSRSARFIASYILRRARHVYCRDLQGIWEIVELLGLQNVNCSFGYDMAFALEPVAPRNASIFELLDKARVSGRTVVGLNISGLLYIGGYRRNNMFGLRTDYRDVIRRLVEFLLQKNATVVLIPHVLGAAAGAESDTLAAEEVFSGLSENQRQDVIVLRDSFSEGEIKFVIGSCDFMIASRMHACIAALSQCVPAVAIAYSDKFSGVLQTIQCESSVADARKLQAGEIIDLIDTALANRDEVARELEARMPEVLRALEDVFDEIRASNVDEASAASAATAAGGGAARPTVAR